MILHQIMLRPAEASDLERMLELAGDSPGAPVWTTETWRRVLESAAAGEQRVVMVAESAKEFAGFGVLGIAGETAELESLAVRTSWRRRGVGKHICEELLGWARAQGAAQVSLEVRVSNRAAHALYEALGFREAGVRRAYYREPQEDGLVMTRAL
jgi:ribosomal-protein-alanine N-acetyltransferase